MFNNDWFTGKNKRGSWTDSYIESLRQQQSVTDEKNAAKKQEDDKKKKQQQQREQANKLIGNVARGAGDLVTGFAKGVAEPFVRLGQGTAEVINEATGGAQKERDQQSQNNQQTIKLIRDLGSKMRAAKTPEEKARYQTAIRNIVKVSDQNDASFRNTQQQIIERTDPVKGAAAVGEVGLNVLTAGSGGALIKGAETVGRATRIADKLINPSTIKQGLASGAVQGALYGATGTALDKGSKATAQDYGINTAFGAAAGGALGAAVPYVGSKIRNAFKPTIKESQQITGKAIEQTDKQHNGFISKLAEPILQSDPVLRTKNMFNDAKVAFKQKLIRSEEPILNYLRQGEKSGKLNQGATQTVETLMRDVKTSEQQAEYFMRGNQNWNSVIQGLNDKGLKDVSKYAEARAELDLIDRGIKPDNGRSDAFKQIVANAPEDYSQRFDGLVNYYKDLRSRLVDEGIISKEQASQFEVADPSYVHVQREIDNMSDLKPQGPGGGAGSIRGTKSLQKRGESTAQTKDLLYTAIGRTQQLEREILRNRAANALIDQLKELDLATPARTAEHVLERRNVMDSMAETRPIKKQLDRFVKTQKKYVGRIQSELDALNNQGLQVSLKKQAPDNLRGKLAEPGIPTSPQETRNIVESLISEDTSKLKAIRKKISTREPKLAQAIDELTNLQDSLDSLNKQRQSEYQQIFANADKKTKNMPTISRRVNGVDEVYTTLPEIEAAAKSWGKVPLGALGRAIAFPTRVLRATVTGPLNPAYLVKSAIRDPIESFVLSPQARATHSPVNIVGSLADAAGKSDLFKEFMRTEGSSTFTDVLRSPKNAAKALREQARLTKPPVQRKAEVITTPSQWFRKWEDVGKTQELLGRYQNFRGAYNAARKNGATKEAALLQARWSARNNMTDFWQTGDWSQIANTLFPYFNPSVQGGARLGRAFKEHPVSTSAKLVAAIQIPTALATMYNLSDPRRAEIYNDIPDYEKDANWIFVLPGTQKTDGKWQVIKIPKPAGIGALSTPVEKMTAAMYGHDPVQFGDFVQAVAKATTPFDVSSPNAFVGSLIPQQIKPLVEGAANYDFFTGRQIVPDWLKDSESEPYKQDFKNTSETARAIGKALNISPLQVEHFVNTTLGEFGKNAINSLDTATNAVTGNEGNVGGRSLVESFTRNFSGASGGVKQTQLSQDFSSVVSQRFNISKQINDAIANNDMNTANQLANDYNIRLARVGVQSDGTIAKLTDKQLKMLDTLRFSVGGGELTPSSIRSRLKQMEKQQSGQ